ncbi:MAG TPA: Ig-like domain-containing protein [Methylomirabilota bacterium]|nr:Ig-like domain-containing protein [Methylomirabilota bacterium]
MTADTAAATGTATGGASVQVFVNGVARGAAALASAEGVWAATGLAPALVAGDVVTARQIVNGVQSAPSARVIVIEGAVRTIAVSVTPFTATVPRGLTRQFTAIGVSSDGLPRDVTATATWSGSNVPVAYVSPSGLATGLNPGTVTVTARREGVSGAASLTVTGAGVVSLAVSPAAPLLFVNQAQQMAVTGDSGFPGSSVRIRRRRGPRDGGR